MERVEKARQMRPITIIIAKLLNKADLRYNQLSQNSSLGIYESQRLRLYTCLSGYEKIDIINAIF